LFDFNVLLRNSDGSWNSENAKEILTFSQAMGYNDIAWELGNEPNSLLVTSFLEKYEYVSPLFCLPPFVEKHFDLNHSVICAIHRIESVLAE